MRYTTFMKLYGDYHMHSEFSGDSKNSIDDIVKMAQEKGLSEIAITDHGPRQYNGIKEKNIPQIRAMIEKARDEHEFPVLFGMESNLIGTNGKIDITDDIRRDIDILLCGIHRMIKPANFRSWFTLVLPNMFWGFLRYFPKGRIKKNTEIMKRVIEQNDIDIWVHPNRYYRLDVVEVARVCVERGTLIELNGSRVSFRPIDFERMRAAGAKFIINSDAHELSQIGRTERVEEFLKNCEWSPEDIVNLHGPFKRERASLLQKVIEENETEEAEEKKDDKEVKRLEKRQAKLLKKQEKKRAKQIKNKL